MALVGPLHDQPVSKWVNVPLRCILQLDTTSRVLHPNDFGPLHDHAGLALGTVKSRNVADGGLKLMTSVVENKRLERSQRERGECLSLVAQAGQHSRL